MPKHLQIDLGDMGPAFEPAELHPLDELMAQALEAPRGIALECADERQAMRQRHKIYKRRSILQDAGQRHFDKIVILIEGNRCIIKREPDFKVIEL